MFTGIVHHTGCVSQKGADTLWILTEFKDLVLGESISVDGVCLTVAEINKQQFRCDVSPETLRLTTLGARKPDDAVNLERALLASDRFGGHMVTGHVDGVCRLLQRSVQGEYVAMEFGEVPHELTQYLVKKGCICVNGVSLTINAVSPQGFSVMLIPHTLQRTNLNNLDPQDQVNIETDYLARFVLHNTAPGVSA